MPAELPARRVSSVILQPVNAVLPRVTASFITTDDREAQPEKALTPTVVTLAGSVMEPSALQFTKASSPTVAVFPRIDTFLSAKQSLKVFFVMLVLPLMVTDTSPLHPWKAPLFQMFINDPS